MSMLEFSIEGPPVPKQSFRMGKYGGYRDPKVTAYQRLVKKVAGETVMCIDWDKTADMHVAIDLVFSDRRRRDLDNHAKGILDAMKGVVFEDDCQVTYLTIAKRYHAQDTLAEVTVTSTDERSKWLPAPKKKGKKRRGAGT